MVRIGSQFAGSRSIFLLHNANLTESGFAQRRMSKMHIHRCGKGEKGLTLGGAHMHVNTIGSRL